MARGAERDAKDFLFVTALVFLVFLGLVSVVDMGSMMVGVRPRDTCQCATTPLVETVPDHLRLSNRCLGTAKSVFETTSIMWSHDALDTREFILADNFQQRDGSSDI